MGTGTLFQTPRNCVYSAAVPTADLPKIVSPFQTTNDGGDAFSRDAISSSGCVSGSPRLACRLSPATTNVNFVADGFEASGAAPVGSCAIGGSCANEERALAATSAATTERSITYSPFV